MAWFPKPHVGPELPPRASVQQLVVIRGLAVTALTVFVAYLYWRGTHTIHGATLALAIPILLTECYAFVSLLLFTFGLWDVDAGQRNSAVDRAPGKVAALIPTYNESEQVLLPAIAGALKMRVPHEVWVLDDGEREAIRSLATQLGAHYLARPTHEHAKAGNLNYALNRIDADFIAVFDADYVPDESFLARTLSYFDDPQVAVVQTPQDFYNTDSFEHMPELGGESFNEERIFYRAIASGKNRWQAAFWAGTCAVLRTEALREIGGVSTDAVTEDIITTIRLQRCGWKAVYHNEVLAQGLAPSDADRYLLQRDRWCSGAMQVLRLENPFFGKGLSLAQRLSYWQTLGGWFESWRLFAYLLFPPLVLLSGGVPISAPGTHLVIALIVVNALTFTALKLLSRGQFAPHRSLVFSVIQMPAVLPATLALLGGKQQFRVTPKGASAGAPRVPRLLLMVVLTQLVAFGWLGATAAGATGVVYRDVPTIVGAALFNLVNAAVVIAAIHRIRMPRFANQLRDVVRFPLGLAATLDGERCVLTDLSVSGARLTRPESPDAARHVLGVDVNLEVQTGGSVVSLSGVVRRVAADGWGVEFSPGQAATIAQLLPLLFPSFGSVHSSGKRALADSPVVAGALPSMTSISRMQSPGS
jgi:cellulose synthase/poly-beta-1,6-N-acetylglucosamine synthase-like glycosyltransferase